MFMKHTGSLLSFNNSECFLSKYTDKKRFVMETLHNFVTA
ncbi:hypothetical protein HSIEG1_3334 [Enterococcus sp. HSIEG1]|nr:hypothetical protein HSIEG1_3334 [Enterococcus sp. HSIEG1]